MVRTHTASSIGPPRSSACHLKIAINPSARAVSFSNIIWKYGAVDFQDVLGDFITQINYPNLTGNALCNLANNTLIPFRSVSVFHKIKFVSTASSNSDQFDVVDTIHVRAEQHELHGHTIPAHFDTVLVCGKDSGPNRMHRCNGMCYLPLALNQTDLPIRSPYSTSSGCFPAIEQEYAGYVPSFRGTSDTPCLCRMVLAALSTT
jgi:hypothetical protein